VYTWVLIGGMLGGGVFALLDSKYGWTDKARHRWPLGLLVSPQDIWGRAFGEATGRRYARRLAWLLIGLGALLLLSRLVAWL